MGKEVSNELRGSEVPYEPNFGRENEDLRKENVFFGDEST